MKSELMTYSYNQVLSAHKALKSFNKTTTKKSEHQTKLEELRQLIYEYFIPLNKWLFEPEYIFGFSQYRNAILCDEPKKKLDNHLNYAIVSLNSELRSILRDMEFGEVNTIT